MNFTVLKKRTEVLAKVVENLSDLYHSGNLDEGQKGLIETLIGAGIWYLPSGKELFSGKISVAALEHLRIDPKSKLVMDHGYPRKISGKALLNEHLDDLKLDNTILYDLYINKMGRYNLVLKLENDFLRIFQRAAVFESEEISYINAGIELIDLKAPENCNVLEELPHLKSLMINSTN
jgi:hypothetical protein